MKRPTSILVNAWAACALAACSSCGGPTYTGPIDGSRAFAHVERMVAFGPREPGSQARDECAAYIRSELAKVDGIDVQPDQVFKVPDRAGEIEFRNVWAKLPGRNPETGGVLILGAHYDTKICHGHDDPEHNFEFQGAIDGAGASAILIELARALAPRQNAPDIWFVWFDGEESLDFEWNDDRALFGSRHFVKTIEEQYKERFATGARKVLVLMDLIGDKQLKLDRDRNSSKKLQDLFKQAAEAMGEADRLYRYESEFQDDHIPFRDFGWAVIDLIDFQYRIPAQHGEGMPEEAKQYVPWWHTPNDTIDKMAPGSLEFVGDLVWETIPRIEQEYFAK